MPYQRHLRRDHAPIDRLARAISDIDRHLEQLRRADKPVPLGAYRARRILKAAQTRCHERTETHPSPSAARPDAMPKPHQARRDPVERYEALPGPSLAPAGPQDFGGCLRDGPETDLRFRKCECGSHAYEGTNMTYDWTGETTRRRNRLKMATAVLLSLAVVLGIPAAVAPFL